MGSIFRFLGLCVCLGVQRGLSRVLIKYSGNVRLQLGISKLGGFAPQSPLCRWGLRPHTPLLLTYPTNLTLLT